MADTKKKSTAGKKDTPEERKAPKKKDAQGKKKAGGRKSVYTQKVLPKLELVEGWARDGLSEKDIAHNLGIALSTLSEYKNKFSEFSEAIKKGKEVSDYIAENRLFLKVCGFSKVIKKPFKIKVPVMQNGIKVADKEEIVTIARKIGTLETSILPYEDCCTVFTPKHPKTKPVLGQVLHAERKLDREALIEKAMASVEKVKVAYHDEPLL